MTKRADKERQPCARCGGEKPPGQGQRYCADCAENARWAAARKRQTRVIRDRAPCQDCGGRKEPGKGRRLCLKCLAKRHPGRRCMHCPKVIAYPAKVCDECRVNISIPAQRERDRARHRRYRATHPKPQRKRKQTPAQIQDRRINYRGRRRVLSQEDYEKRYGRGFGRSSQVPLAPLLPMLREVCGEVGMKAVAEVSGVSVRWLWNALTNNPDQITAVNADKFCTYAGIPFAEIYGAAA